MAFRRDRRWIWAIGIVLFFVGFSYGVYRSFKEMHGTPGIDQAQPQPESGHEDPDIEGGLGGIDLLDYWIDANPGGQMSSDRPAGQQDGIAAHDDQLPAEDGEDVYYLGIHQNRVAVFEGLPSEGRLFRMTDRSVDSLPPREVASLRTGIRVVGEREMLKALEGFMY